MKPARLFVILLFLTASALVIVHLRIASVRAAHRIQKLHAEEWELRQKCVRQSAEIAALANPQAVKELEQKTAPVAPSISQPPQDWETD